MDDKQTRRSFVSNAVRFKTWLLILRNSKSVCSYRTNEKLNIACIGVGGQDLTNLKAVNIGSITVSCNVSGQRAAETFNPSYPIPRFAGFQDWKMFLVTGKVINEPEANKFLHRKYCQVGLNQPLQWEKGG
ncbi:MAG: hypothetical protein N3B10_10025 [Armatimonadetes bacterium]|nr:hypothetical protein [Armatimonadota bacterium]MCX7968803.1 hypothetical protein [Armatimonadota bacterium]MDW8143906.1 hypothetical protein [Armatimonadota bacterium]